MGLCLGKTPGSASPSSPHWPDLPPEIAGQILSRLSSHDDRLSFGAVCPEWHLAARQNGLMQPPAMPCINLGNGKYQSITDGKVRRFPTPKGYHAGGSYGGWLLYYHERSGRSFLHAHFSSDTVEVPIDYHSSFVDFPTAMTWAFRTRPDIMHVGRSLDMKMVVCSSQLVVAIFRHPGRGDFHPISYFASSRPAQLRTPLHVLSFAVQPHDHHPVYVYRDITFYHGNIFALSCCEDLFCHDIHGQANHLPITYHEMDTRPNTLATNCYLVVSSDKQKLLMVRWQRRSISAMDLWVFEADFGTGRWVEVKDLGDQVLFLGKNSSMAFAVLEHWGQKFQGGNRVFVLGTECAQSLGLPICNKRDIPSYFVYDMRSGETSLVFLDGARCVESFMSGWFFP